MVWLSELIEPHLYLKLRKEALNSSWVKVLYKYDLYHLIDDNDEAILPTCGENIDT